MQVGWGSVSESSTQFQFITFNYCHLTPLVYFVPPSQDLFKKRTKVSCHWPLLVLIFNKPPSGCKASLSSFVYVSFLSWVKYSIKILNFLKGKFHQNFFKFELIPTNYVYKFSKLTNLDPKTNLVFKIIEKKMTN